MRQITRITATRPASPGTLGDGHTAVEVLAPDNLDASDPFVLLIDDRFDWPGPPRPMGGPHPHAGLETVTFVLDGTLHDDDEGDLHAGDVMWLTAGRGIVHNETLEIAGRARILHLWIALPMRERGLSPAFQVIAKSAAPLVEAPGVQARVYSGGADAPRPSRVPIDLVDVRLAPGAAYLHDLPADYSGFAYMLEGDVRIGRALAGRGDVAWFKPGEAGLELVGGPVGARAILYAGEPVGEMLVHRGPFVAGTMDEIAAYFRRYHAALFPPMSDVARRQRAHRQRIRA